MAKRWRSMDAAERADYRARLDAVTDGMVSAFAGTEAGDELWQRFTAYAMSLGDVLDGRNAVRAFCQHVRTGNATPTDLRTWTEWTTVGRTPMRKRDVVILTPGTEVPSHLWDVADTEVTDRKAWRKAPAKPRRADGARVLESVAAMVWDGHAVDVSASLPSVPAAPAEPAPTPADVQRARLRSEGRTGSLDAMLRAEYDDAADARYLALETATNGHVLNDRGRERKVDARTFVTSGNVKTVTAYGSEETVAYFAANGGVPSFASYKARLMGERPARQDLVVAG